MKPAVSIILPTCGRPTLRRALQSVLPQLGERDEVLVVGDGRQPAARRVMEALGHSQLRYHEHGPTGFLGNAQRNFAQGLAQGDLVAFLDDDDYYDSEALTSIRRAWQETPGRPYMFRIRFHDPPFYKWKEPVYANENISGGSFVVPNVPGRIGRWPGPEHPHSAISDRVFIDATLAHWSVQSLVWRTEVIYHVPRAGRNAP